jgi:S-adenosylmethionine hydrolase
VADAANPAASATIPGFEVVNGMAVALGVDIPTQITAGTDLSAKVTVTDAWGNRVKNYFGTVHFDTSAALAGLPADYTFNGEDAGVHTFTLTLNTSGNQTLSVVDTSNALLTGSVSGAVKPGEASSVLVTFPVSTTAGTAQEFTVAAVDAFGNVATDYRGTVEFSSSDVQAGLPASYTFANKDEGSHTFTATLRTVGLQSITVQDTEAGFTATQSGIRVSPAVAAGSFVVTGFPATTAGVAQSFTVAVKDVFGNLATGYTGTVLFSSSDVQAGLPASYTFTEADAGVHTFTATLKTAGTQSITVKDAGNAASGSETGIAIAASPILSSLSVTGFPATTAGTAQKFTVKATDAYGNAVTGYTGTVTFSSSDVQAGLPASYTFTAADAGSHTFTATLKTAGTQAITVTDAASGIVASETGITVNAGAATQFSISAPVTATQGVGFKITVTVLDAYGNVVTGYRGKVRLNSTDGKGGKQDYTFSSSDRGVHVFSYTFNALGNQTLTVVDSSNDAILGTATVNVVPKK